ncbi:MAG: AI-2E family transporter [Rhodobacteraceae bacterium]|nr:AI-2E family transporter [Paracoccaceae bacterium]
MALARGTQLKYWTIAAAIFFVALWYLGDVILPFVLGSAVAYFLDPVADRLEAMGCSRALSTVIITLLAVLLFIVAILAVVPTLVNQTIALVNVAPTLFTDLQTFLTDRFPSLMEEDSVIRQSLYSLGQTIQSRGGEFVGSIISSAMSFVNVLILLVVTPVVAFYMLLDWDRMVAILDDMLPRDHAPVIRQLAHDIDGTLASFIRGMGTVCLILGTYYAIALMAVGLSFGLVVGAIAGLLTFIPYVGALIGGGLAIGLAMFQFWSSVEVLDGDTVTYATDWFRIVLVAAIFVAGQVAEGNILTPKLVGTSVGLHPVWLLFALSAFGALFGFVGMLVAVPVAAAIGVVTRFFMGAYKDGRLYQGVAGKSKSPDE